MTDLVPYLARRLCHWQVLTELHRGGRAAGLRRVAEDSGSASFGACPDGVWRAVEHHGRLVDVRVGSPDAGCQRVPSGLLVDYAAERLTVNDGELLAALDLRWADANRRANPTPPRRSFRGYAMPWEREADAERNRCSVRLRAVADAVFARQPAEQLDLFAGAA